MVGTVDYLINNSTMTILFHTSSFHSVVNSMLVGLLKVDIEVLPKSLFPGLHIVEGTRLRQFPQKS